MNFSMPGGTYTVGRDVPVGSRITPWTGLQTSYTNIWQCTLYYPDAMVVAGQATGNLVTTGTTYTEGGNTYPVYATNLTGVGLVLGAANYTNTDGWGAVRVVGPSLSSYGGIQQTSGTTTYYWGVGLTVALVKTGPIMNGVVNAPGPVVNVGMSPSPPSTMMRPAQMVLNGSTAITAASCTVADIDVPLGTHRPSEFTLVGSKVGTTDFTINVTNCPAGMTSVRYRLELAPGIAAYNAASGIVKLDAASTATGVAVQVMNQSNVPYNFSTMPWTNVTPTYAPATGGNYTIPLRAAYYQTAATVTTGDANSAVMFTMEYK